MKRDMDLIRKILLAVEASPHGFAGEIQIDSASTEEIGYHSHLICEAGLAHGLDTTARGPESPIFRITALTWAGHEFIEAGRNEETWNKAKSLVDESGGGLAFDLLKNTLHAIIQAGVSAAITPKQ